MLFHEAARAILQTLDEDENILDFVLRFVGNEFATAKEEVDGVRATEDPKLSRLCGKPKGL
jgi:hypothetical protein